MSSGPGWVGPKRVVLNYLRVCHADKDEEGRYIIGPPGRGGIFMFLGIDDPDNDAVIDSDTVFYINGSPAPLAAGLRATSSGICIYVISGYEEADKYPVDDRQDDDGTPDEALANDDLVAIFLD